MELGEWCSFEVLTGSVVGIAQAAPASAESPCCRRRRRSPKTSATAPSRPPSSSQVTCPSSSRLWRWRSKGCAALLFAGPFPVVAGSASRVCKAATPRDAVLCDCPACLLHAVWRPLPPSPYFNDEPSGGGWLTVHVSYDWPLLACLISHSSPTRRLALLQVDPLVLPPSNYLFPAATSRTTSGSPAYCLSLVDNADQGGRGDAGSLGPGCSASTDAGGRDAGGRGK